MYVFCLFVCLLFACFCWLLTVCSVLILLVGYWYHHHTQIAVAYDEMRTNSVRSRPPPPPVAPAAAAAGGGGGGGGGEGGEGGRREGGTGGGIYEELEAFGGKPFSMKRNMSYSTVVVRNAL